jgi:ribokinase
MLDLLCLGNVTIDDVTLADETTQAGCLGGDAIYATVAARLWSDAVAMVAPVGCDFPTAQMSRLAAAEFDPHGLPVRDIPTRRNAVTYHRNGSRVWRVLSDPGDLEALSPTTADIPPSLMRTRFALVLAMGLRAQEELVAGLRAHDVPVALDPQEDYVAGNEQRILSMLRSVEVFLPSEIEAERLLGHRDFERAARQFADRGCSVVAIKLGAQGVLVYDAKTDRFLRAAAAPAQVLDTTGAGDTFSGGFMAVYARTRDLDAATAAGLVAASFAVEGFGSMHLCRVTRQCAARRLRRWRAASPEQPGRIE